MPRKKQPVIDLPRRPFCDLVHLLADEIRSGRESGQPVIYEREFPTGVIRATVLWDRFDHVPPEDRTSIILRAFEQAEGAAYRERIALASGLTVPEAEAAGMLPYQILPALRPGDAVTREQCREAMIEEGASTLFGADTLLLRFPNEEDAEAARLRLSARLPGSEPVWFITRQPSWSDNGLQDAS